MFAALHVMFAALHAAFDGNFAPLSYRLVPFIYNFAGIFLRGKFCRARRSGTVILAICLFHKHLLQNHLQVKL
jgi:hypothetical protein